MPRRILTPMLITVFLVAGTAPVFAQDAPPPPTAKQFSDRAIVKLAAFKHKEARTDLEAKKDTYGNTAFYKTAWALLLFDEGKLSEAATALNQAANQDKLDPAADYYRGEVLYWQKKKNDAEKAWKRCHDRAKAQVQKEPGNARAHYYLGASLVRKKEFAKARTSLKTAREKGFTPKLVDFQVGLTFSVEKKYQDAKNAFDKVIEADSGFAHAYFYRGLAWKQLKRTDQMMLDLDRFLKLAPQALEASAANALLRAGGG